ATAADERLGVEAVRDHVTAAIDVVVHLGRSPDGTRRLAAVAEVTGHDRVCLLADDTEVRSPIVRPARLNGIESRAARPPIEL
ncbi:MAG: hypothetical protein OXC00_11535, partial [Acidimicrobiaceae bacterium]|nr:hypothetical protein [Acidimicrobiaceae bacterium]